MQLSVDQMRWLLKVIQPEKTLASLPNVAALTDAVRASLLGLPPEVYASVLAQMTREATDAAHALAADDAITAALDRLALKPGAKVCAFGDSHTSDPQSWAVMVRDLLAARGVAMTIHAVPGDTTTHALIRVGEVIAKQPDWVLFFLGINDARTQGPQATKTLVSHDETARNLRALSQRISNETQARCLWMTPPAVNEARVATHWGLSRFGVRFRNEDVARVAAGVRALEAPTVDLFSTLGAPPSDALLMDDGLHFTLAGQTQLTRAVLAGWSRSL